MVFQDEFIADQEQIRSVLDYDITIRELPPDYSYYVALTGKILVIILIISRHGKKIDLNFIFSSEKMHIHIQFSVENYIIEPYL